MQGAWHKQYDIMLNEKIYKTYITENYGLGKIEWKVKNNIQKMSKLKFNDSIFTNVKKFENNIPLGVLVSGKLNQYNHQGYPILDAIDIDWNGAYLKKLNTYIYTTEDLINCLNVSYSNFGNYVSLTYFENILGDTIEDLEDKITYSYNNALTYSTYNFDKIINIINDLKDKIYHTNVIDKNFYYKVEY